MLEKRPKNVENPPQKCKKSSQKVQKILQKKCPESDRLVGRSGKNNGKTSTFLPQASRSLPDKFSENLRKFCEKRDGKPPKPHRKYSKAVRKFVENSAGNQAKLRQKSAQNSAEKVTKPCRQFPIMVPEVHRQAVVRAAPLSSPKISPIFLKKYFAVIFLNVLLNLLDPEFDLALQLCVAVSCFCQLHGAFLFVSYCSIR